MEACHRLGLNDDLGLTADVRYVKDQYVQTDPLQVDSEGWISGSRLTAQF